MLFTDSSVFPHPISSEIWEDLRNVSLQGSFCGVEVRWGPTVAGGNSSMMGRESGRVQLQLCSDVELEGWGMANMMRRCPMRGRVIQ